MAKRNRGPRPPVVNVTSSTTVEVSGGISSAEFKQLLDLQASSLGELTSMKALLELSKEHQKNQQVSTGNEDALHLQMELLATMRDHAVASKKHYKTDEEMQKKFETSWDKESSQITEAAKAMNTTGNVFQEMAKSWKDKKEAMKEKTSISGGGLKRTVLGALNVGGVFNKAIAKSEWSSKQKEMGYNPSKADAETAYNSSKDLKAHDEAISKFQKKTGLKDDEAMRGTPKGRELLEKRGFLADKYASVDKSTHRFDPTPVKELTGKTPTATAAEATQGEEAQLEGARDQQGMQALLSKIEENTRGGAGGKKPEKVKPAEGKEDSLLDTIMGFLGDGLIQSFKSMFSPMKILKFLGKAFAIGAIIGALWEGISDGFDEYMKTGDIGKALIAGLAGIVDFLTFGLFDKDKIKEVIGDMAAWTNDHIVQPIFEFFSAMKDSFLSLISKIGIPEIKFTIPVIGKEVSIGPFYPFKDAAPSSKAPEAPAPTSANSVDQKSADNAAAATQGGGGGNKTNVVNAPVTTNNNSTQVIRAPIRNQDSSANNYMRARYA